MSYGKIALLETAVVLTVSLVLLRGKPEYPFRLPGLRSGIVALAVVLAALAGAFDAPVVKVLGWLQSPEAVLMAKACLIACVLVWFSRFYGYVLLFVLVSSAFPGLSVNIEAPPRWWWALPVGVLLFNLLLAATLRR